jgi:hypothetical protein
LAEQPIHNKTHKKQKQDACNNNKKIGFHHSNDHTMVAVLDADYNQPQKQWLV